MYQFHIAINPARDKVKDVWKRKEEYVRFFFFFN